MPRQNILLMQWQSVTDPLICLQLDYDAEHNWTEWFQNYVLSFYLFSCEKYTLETKGGWIIINSSPKWLTKKKTKLKKSEVKSI